MALPQMFPSSQMAGKTKLKVSLGKDTTSEYQDG